MERDYPKYTAWMRLDTSCSQCSIHMLKMYLFVEQEIYFVPSPNFLPRLS